MGEHELYLYRISVVQAWGVAFAGVERWEGCKGVMPLPNIAGVVGAAVRTAGIALQKPSPEATLTHAHTPLHHF